MLRTSHQNRGLRKSLVIEEMVNEIIITSRTHSKLKKKRRNWDSISGKVVHHVSKTTRKRRLIRKRKKNRKMIPIRMRDRLLKKKRSITRTFVRLSIWRNRNHRRLRSRITGMKTEVTANLVKEEATTREVEIVPKGVFIRRGTTNSNLICRMNTKRILKDKDRPTTTRINNRKTPNKITRTRFDLKEDAVATILVEVIENKGPRLSNTSPERTLTKA
jgi:hypothetical protein